MKLFFLSVSVMIFIGAFQATNCNFIPETQDMPVIIDVGISSTLNFDISTKISNLNHLLNSQVTEITSWIQSVLAGKIAIEGYQRWQNPKQEIPMNRITVKEIISYNPGISLREIQRSTGLAMGVLQYHLRFLEDGEIESLKQGRSKHFFEVKSQFSYEEKIFLSLTRNLKIRKILTSLSSTSTIYSQKDLVDQTGNSRALISYYIKILKQQGIIDCNSGDNKLRITADYELISKSKYWK